MFKAYIWDYYAGWYEKLWVQKFVLKPSRKLILKTLETLPSTENMLDVGCGIGELCREMSSQFRNSFIVGMDPSAKMIERARKESVSGQIDYHNGFLKTLNHGQLFDVIVSTHAFPYMPDKREVLTQLSLKLKPGGRLLLLCANRNNLYDAIWLSLVKLTTSKAEYPSVSSIHQMMKNAGYTVGRTQRIKSRRFVPSVYMVEGVLSENRQNNSQPDIL